MNPHHDGGDTIEQWLELVGISIRALPDLLEAALHADLRTAMRYDRPAFSSPARHLHRRCLPGRSRLLTIPARRRSDPPVSADGR